MFWAIGLTAAAVGFGFVFPRSLVGRTLSAILGVVGLKVRRFEDANALGLYDRALERQGAALKEGAEGLGEFRAIVEGLKRQIANARSNVEKLGGRLDAMDHQGIADTDAAKLQAATQLATWQGRLESLEAQLADKRAIGDRGIAGLKLASAKLHDGKQERQFLAADLEAAAAESKITGVLSGFGDGLDGAASDMAEARERLERQIDTQRARSSVMAEVSGVADAIGIEQAAATAAGADVLAARRAKAIVVE